MAKGTGNAPTKAEKKAAREKFINDQKTYAAGLGINLPPNFYQDYYLKSGAYFNNPGYAPGFVNPQTNNPQQSIDDYVRDPKTFWANVTKQLSYYYTYMMGAQSGITEKGKQSALDAFKNKISEIAPYAVRAGLNQNEFTQIIESGLQLGADNINAANAYLASLNEDSWLDKIAAPVMAVTGAIATGGLSLAQQVAFNAVGAALQGGNIEDILRGALATLAVNEIPGFLDQMKLSVNNPQMQAVIDNVAKQATAAAIKGQDVKAAALGGLAGGAVSQGISTSGQEFSYGQQIARAAGEYVQAKTAGLSEEQALTRALTGFISQSEKEEAREKILQKVESGTYIDPNKERPQPGTSEFREMEGKTLPTVEVTGERFKPTTADKLSIVDQAQVGEKGQNKNLDPRYRILLSILNQPLSGTSQFTQSGGDQKSSVTTTGQGASPGTSALAQALRTDTNETIIAGDKSGRRKGWNLESLRYMGNSGG